MNACHAGLKDGYCNFLTSGRLGAEKTGEREKSGATLVLQFRELNLISKWTLYEKHRRRDKIATLQKVGRLQFFTVGFWAGEFARWPRRWVNLHRGASPIVRVSDLIPAPDHRTAASSWRDWEKMGSACLCVCKCDLCLYRSVSWIDSPKVSSARPSRKVASDR